MPPRLMRCIAQVVDRLRDRFPKMSLSRARSRAYGICISTTGLRPHKRGRREYIEWRINNMKEDEESYVEFVMEASIEPLNVTSTITEEDIKAFKDKIPEGAYPVHGVALYSCTSRNNVTYLPEEIEKATPTFVKKPFMKDHRHDVDGIIGRVGETKYSKENSSSMEYMGWIDPSEAGIISKIKSETINNVSISAKAERIDCSSCGGRFHDCKCVSGESEKGKKVTAVPRNMSGIEISVVVMPGIPNASIHGESGVPRDGEDWVPRSLEEKVHILEQLKLENNKKENEEQKMDKIEDLSVEALKKNKHVAELIERDESQKSEITKLTAQLDKIEKENKDLKEEAESTKKELEEAQGTIKKINDSIVEQQIKALVKANWDEKKLRERYESHGLSYIQDLYNDLPKDKKTTEAESDDEISPQGRGVAESFTPAPPKPRAIRLRPHIPPQDHVG